MIRVAINGFGRIGRSVYRLLADEKDVDVVAVNDITDPKTLVYLLKHDTVMGPYQHALTFENDTLKTANMNTAFSQVRNPLELPWAKMDVDVTIESTGVFRTREQVEGHIKAGSKKVLLTVPPKDGLDAMIVMGVNDDDLKPEHKTVSNASCTTNCLAPLAKLMHDAFGIQKGFLSTVHAYTNDQNLNDHYHKDYRRARAANENIIFTTTGAARAVGKVYAPLSGKLDGAAMRVPVPDGSVIDLSLELEKDTTEETINELVQEAASQHLKGIVQYADEPLVSTDILGNPHSSIFDPLLTKVQGGKYAKIVAWYDNEWGYSNRVVDLAKMMA